jgi:hypothetical protein
MLTSELRLKDVTKVLGKKFSSGASVNETASGAKEVQFFFFFQQTKHNSITQIIIQGDFIFELPELLIREFSVIIVFVVFLISHS